jgi:RNA polymerase sigma factor (sigma-70 family)
MPGDRVEDLLRELAPQVVGALARQYGQFEAAEDAAQEALVAALVQWPAQGVPEHPRAWLLTVARRSLIDQWRSDSARRRREEVVAGQVPDEPPTDTDDTLALLFMCCHPVLTLPAQIALTLRAVGGLTTAQIAGALLVPEETMVKRITRAKRRITEAGARFELPAAPDLQARLQSVLAALYLIFNEGYTASSGTSLHRLDLSAEAIRLTRLLHRVLPADGEVAGLLALMLLTDARRLSRTGPDGSLVPLHEQDRSTWDRAAIEEGLRLVTGTLGRFPIGQYQLQAAIAAVHDEAETAEATDWPQILALYDTLQLVAPGPVVTLSRAVAVAMVHGPLAGLALLGTLENDGWAARSHRLPAVRAHLLEMAGRHREARQDYLRAARMTASLPEQRYLQLRASQLAYY